MKRVHIILAFSFVVVPVLTACGGGGGQGKKAPAGPPPVYVEEAKIQFPKLLDLHTQVIARTCTPNPNVCHNSGAYPDLHTVGNLLSMVKAPCNVELPDVLQGWDHCELPADRLSTNGFSSKVAWTTQESSGNWVIGLAQAAPYSGSYNTWFETADGNDYWWVGTEDVSMQMTGGSKQVQVSVVSSDEWVTQWVDEKMTGMISGDPNQNGTWGGDTPSSHAGAVVTPGNLEESYLWGRLTGTVPGTRMPLANTPLSNAEYVAMACWIEGLSGDGTDRADDLIDYEGCDYAKAPTDYAVSFTE